MVYCTLLQFMTFECLGIDFGKVGNYGYSCLKCTLMFIKPYIYNINHTLPSKTR